MGQEIEPSTFLLEDPYIALAAESLAFGGGVSKEGEKHVKILIVSDGTGETADQMVKAALFQFRRDGLQVVRHKNIRTQPQVLAVIEEAKSSEAVLVYTIVTESTRLYLREQAQIADVPTVDLLGPLMDLLGQHLKKDPKAQPGLFHQVNEYYFKRIEAIEFTVKHDDGRYADNLKNADVILVGLSRTSKTPLSVYLSYKGWKVANVPVVKDIPLPQALFETDQRKIVGLLIQPDTLTQIRRERLIRMGEDPGGDYAKPEYIVQEIEYCKALFRKNRRWPVFDVTGKALEEIASEVEKYIRLSIPEKYGASS